MNKETNESKKAGVRKDKPAKPKAPRARKTVSKETPEKESMLHRLLRLLRNLFLSLKTVFLRWMKQNACP